jgi:60 kDa SS-A/Ro ribonucleoprotein
MPTTAMLRNLGKMTSTGIFNKRGNAEIVKTAFTDQARLHEGRIHPVNLYVALKTYESGHGLRGSLAWIPSGTIVSALNTGFELAYKGLPKIHGRVLIALDVSGSMSSSTYNGVVSARELSIATAKALMTQMDDYTVCLFSSGMSRHGGFGWGDRRDICTKTFAGFQKLEVPFDARVTDLVRTSEQYAGMFSRTDCAIPALWATAVSEVYDAMIIITDNETYVGSVHPSMALRAYREKIQKPVKSIVLGVTATGFSIADPTDPNSLDLVGFDSNVPTMIGDFISGTSTTAGDEIDE